MQAHNAYPPPGAPAMGAAAAGADSYEFGPMENETIAQTAKYTTMWGYIALVLGALSLIGLIFAIRLVSYLTATLGAEGDMNAGAMVAGFIAVLLPLALVNLVVGWLYVQSGKKLRSVVDTSGNDIKNLVSGLDKLGNAFRLEVIVTILGFIGVIVTIISAANG